MGMQGFNRSRDLSTKPPGYEEWRSSNGSKSGLYMGSMAEPISRSYNTKPGLSKFVRGRMLRFIPGAGTELR